MSAGEGLRTERLARAGALRRLRGDPAGAEPLLRAALAATEQAYPRDAVRLAHALNELGLVCKDLARYDEARAMYQRALRLLLEAPGSHPGDIATLQHNLGGIEHARGDSAAGEPHARNGLALRRVSGEGTGREPALAADMIALGAILDARGEYAEAERLYLDGLAILERAPDAHAPEIAVALNDLGASYAQRGMLSDAVATLERAAALKRRILGPRHHELAVTLNNLAVVHERRRDHARAAALYAEAVSILERSLGSAHPRTVSCRGNEARCSAARDASLAG